MRRARGTADRPATSGGQTRAAPANRGGITGASPCRAECVGWNGRVGAKIAPALTWHTLSGLTGEADRVTRAGSLVTVRRASRRAAVATARAGAGRMRQAYPVCWAHRLPYRRRQEPRGNRSFNAEGRREASAWFDLFNMTGSRICATGARIAANDAETFPMRFGRARPPRSALAAGADWPGESARNRLGEGSRRRQCLQARRNIPDGSSRGAMY